MSNQGEHRVLNNAILLGNDATATEGDQHDTIAGSVAFRSRGKLVFGVVILAGVMGAAFVLVKGAVDGHSPIVEAPQGKSASLEELPQLDVFPDTGCQGSFETLVKLDEKNLWASDCNSACVKVPECDFALFQPVAPTPTPVETTTLAPKDCQVPKALTVIPPKGQGGTCYDGSEVPVGGHPWEGVNCGGQTVCGNAWQQDDSDFTTAEMCCKCGAPEGSCLNGSEVPTGLGCNQWNCNMIAMEPIKFCDGRIDDTDFTAADMCCVCKTQAPTSAPVPTPCEIPKALTVIPPKGQDGTCYDGSETPVGGHGWEGVNCGGETVCTNDWQQDDSDFTTKEMCCKCGAPEGSCLNGSEVPTGAGCSQWNCHKIAQAPQAFCDGRVDDTDFTAADMCCVCKDFNSKYKNDRSRKLVGTCTLGRGVCDKGAQAGAQLAVVNRPPTGTDAPAATPAPPPPAATPAPPPPAATPAPPAAPSGTCVQCGKGCSNWESILLDRRLNSAIDSCASLCKQRNDCKSYNVQTSDTGCAEQMPGEGTCYLFGEGCMVEDSPCWTLFQPGC